MTSPAIRLPDGTRQRLEEFQSLVRKIKVTEGILAGLFGLVLSYIAVFVLDRFVDTAAVVRTASIDRRLSGLWVVLSAEVSSLGVGNTTHGAGGFVAQAPLSSTGRPAFGCGRAGKRGRATRDQ